MRKIYRLGIMMLLMLAAALPAARAYNFVSDGIYYDITGGSPNTVSVTYATGSYNSYSGSVTIPSTVTYNGTHYTVTAIGNNAFRNCSNLTGVTIPGTVTSIGEYAFYSCGRLHSVTFPTNLTTIGANAFYYSGLYSVTIPAAVTSIGSNAFRQCSSLRSANFFASNCTSASSIFYGCSHLDTLTIGSNVHNLPGSAFSDLSALKKVHIPNSVTSMGNNPFAYCPNLDTIVVAAGNSVFSSGNHSSYIVNTSTHTLVTGCKRTVIPNSVTHIGGAAFAGCTGLTGALTIPNQITIIGANAYSGCTGLTSLTIGHAVDSIGNSAFSSCSGISSVSFNADSCRYMGTASSYVVFSGCSSFSTLTIGNNVKAIPADAFYGCNHLTGMLVIPNSVKYIGNSAFSGCNGLTSLSLGNSVTIIGGWAFSGCSNMGATLTIPHSVRSIGSYAFSGCTSFSSIAFNADSCSNGSLSGCSNVTSLTIGNNVKVIPNNAFENCSHLAGSVTIPNAVSTIGSTAFRGCSNLNAIVFNADSCTYMGGSGYYAVFSNCGNLSSLTIGNNVKVIPDYAFYGLSTLTGSLTIPESVVSIGRLAFSNCSGLTGNLTIPPLVSVIEQQAFENCSGFSGSLVISNTVHTISDLSFSGCSGLDTLIIGKSVDTIRREAFKNCSSLSHIAYNANHCHFVGSKVGYSTKYDMFVGCTNPFTLSIGDNVKNIPKFLFTNCTGLTGTVNIPDSVATVGQSAFQGCSGLDSLIIGKSVASIAYGTFSNCSNLSYVEFNADSCSSAGYMDYNGNVAGLFGGCSHPAKLVIGSTVKCIPSYIFSHFSGLTGNVTIPNSTHFIGDYAFYECNNLDSLVIGNAIVSIGQYAFNNCSQLCSVEFNADSCATMGDTYDFVFTGCSHAASLFVGDNVKIIPANAFRNFTGLESVTIGNAVSSIGEYAFYGCNNLASLVLGNSITSIPQYAFYNCSSLSSLTLPNTLISIGQRAFDGCSSLSSIIIPDAVTYIGGYAFNNCSGLDSIVIGESATTMLGYAFGNCPSLSYVLFKADSCVNNGGSSESAFRNSGTNTTLIISNNVKHLPPYNAFTNFTGLRNVIYNADSCVSNFSSAPFGGCNNLAKLSIGNNVKSIPSNLFNGCSGLSGTLVIPDSVFSIGSDAFRDCSGLDTIIIGRAVSSMGQRAFSYCSNLRTVIFNADSCTSMFSGSYYTNYDVFYGCDSLISLIIGSNVKIIPEYAFRGRNLSGKLIIPDALSYIGQYAFNGCTGLDSLVIGNAVTYIGQYAFYNCTGLTGTLCLPNVDTIGYRAFYNCGGINSLILGEGVDYIGGQSFYNCNSLTGMLNIPNSVTNIGGGAFYGCTSFGTLVIGRGVAAIGSDAFKNCIGLTYVTFNADSCTSIGQYNYDVGFAGDTNITYLSLGENVKIIPKNAFYGGNNTPLSKLSGKLEIPNSVIEIGQNAFKGCSGYDTLVIGRGVKIIYQYAFDGWSGLTTLFFNADSCESMTSDHNNEISVFTNCQNLVTLNIGKHVKYLPYIAFSKCSHLDGTIVIPDSIKRIRSNAFAGCSSIDTLIIGKGTQMIDDYVFKNCTGLNHITFNADSCTKMGSSWSSSVYSVFNGCTSYLSLSIGDNVKIIPPYAFYGLNHITGTLNIPDSVKTIGNSAFYNCSSVTKLILGRSVDSIGTAAFSGCNGLTSITSYNVTPPTLTLNSTRPFNNVNRNTPVYVPCGSAQAYRNAWTYSTTNTSSYFNNVYETISPYHFDVSSEDMAKGTVQVTTLPTCTGPAVIEATPKFFYVFDHWSDGSTDNPRTIELTQDTTLVAHFREYALNINCDTAYGRVVILQAPTAENPQAVVEMVADTSCYNFYSWITPANDWESIGNENPITITLTQDTTIRATVTSRLSMNVSLLPQWTDFVCEGDTMILTASGAESYMWTNRHWDSAEGRYVDDDTLGFNADLHLTEVGSYRLRVTGTDSSGCKGWYNVQQVHVFPNPDFTINGATDICEGESTTLSVSLGQYESELFEDFSNGLPNNWSVNYTNLLSYYELENSSHGRAVLFPCYQLNSGMSVDLRLPSLNFNNSEPSTLSFDVAYRSYSGEADQLRVLYSIDNGNSWNVLYSKSGSNLATLSPDHQEFFPTDDKWRKDSVNLSMLSGMYDVLVKFEFTSRYGNNLWIDNVQIDNVLVSSTNPYSHDYLYYYYFWSNGATGSGIYQQTVDSDGVYSVTVSSGLCSSTDSVTVTVWQPDTIELTVTAEHSPYTLNGETFCTSGDYTQTLQNIHGCDSVVTIHLTVPTDTTFVYDTLCVGERAFEQSIMSPGEYQQTLAMLESQFGDSIPYELTYDTNTHIVSVKAVTIYINEVWISGYEDYGGWTEPVYSYFDSVINLNYNVWKDSSYYNFTYTLTYPSSLGCDSTVTKHLTAKFSDASYWLVTACGSYVWNGDTIVSSGEYYHSFTNVNGCDSTETLYLTVLPSVSEELSATTCDSYTWNGITYTESGDYTLNSDTTLALVRNLYVNNWGEWGYDDADGNFIYLQPNGWSQLQVHTDYDSETGDYTYYYYYFDQNGAEHLYNLGDIVPYIDTVPGCKSATLHLIVNESKNTETTAGSCDSYTWNGSTYTTSGDYTQTFTAANGCDSVVTLHLTIHPSVAELVEATACDSYTWNGQTYTASGDYTQTFTADNGCDSTVTLHLTILPLPTPNITGVTTVCEGQTATLNATGGVSYLWEDGTATASFSTTESGVYTVTATNAEGCSATASATVTVNPLPEVAVTGNTYICPGGSTVLTATGAATYMWSNGNTNAAIPVNAFGQYSVIGTSAEGCFSTASVTVLVSQPPVITISGNTNLCAGESTTLTATGGVSYMWSNGSADSAITVNTAGNWQVIGYNENNCSNMASVTVNVWQPAATDLYITSFDSCYTWFGTPRCESGDYTHTLQTIHGCDSVITLHLTLEDAIVTEFSATACDSYTWNGATYSQSGNYTQSFTAVNGNDSIVTLHLTVNNPVHTAVTAESCGSYEWNGQTYTVSGDYTHEHLDANGCTQVDTLHLTIFNPVHTAVTAGSCGPYEWNGQTYTVSGDYTHEHLDANGCTQVDTLHLTIFYPVHTAVTAESCGSYEWNGQTYTVSGDYTHEHLDANGCTQVDTLHLTVNDTQHIEFADSTCTTYVWNGQTYTASGDYTQTFAAANGCDSVVTLHLTIVPAITPVISVTGSLAACGDGSATLTVPGLYNSFAWSTGSTDPAITVSEAGFYWVTATDVYGCEGVSEMVQVGSSVQIEETPAICMVGVEDQHNLVVWEPLADSDVAEYRLYRENGQANIFEPLAVIPAGSGNAYADTTADPSVRAWRYKITAADTCGSETPMSALHKTVHLTINQGLGNSYNLIWTPYEGFEFASYRLYRGTANNNLQLIQTMPSTLTSFTDQNPTGDALFYQIEVVMDGSCVQETRDITFTGARSNIVYNGVPVATDVTVEACESYDWNGEVLTSSGEYTHSFNSVLGYDSVVTLHLTIHQPAASEFTVSCPDSCYTWNGTEYCASGDYTQTLQTVHGCDSVVTLHLTITVGIDDHDLAGSVKVFPNPANSMLNVQWAMGNEAATIELLDVTGKLLRTISATGETTSINVSSLADGMYFVRVTTEAGAVTKTFVVKR